MKEPITLDFLVRQRYSFLIKGKVLTDIVIGIKEAKEIKNWSSQSISEQAQISKELSEKLYEQLDFGLKEQTSQVWGVQVHALKDKDSYYKGYDLGNEEEFNEFLKLQFEPLHTDEEKSKMQYINTKESQ